MVMLKSSVTVLPHWSRAVTRTAVVPVTAVAGERAVQRVEVQPRRQVRAVGLLRAIGQESLDLTHATHATIFSTTLGVADLATIMVAQGPRHCLQPRALGRKPSDEFAVPLCRSHHRAVHRAGDEQAWWKAAGIDPVKVARQLWRQTRLDDRQEHHQAGLWARPQTRSIASASEGTRESRSDQVAIGQADDGRTP